MLKYQFTFYDPTKHYKPISTIITPAPHEKFSSMKKRATLAVCIARNWTVEELVKFGYSKIRYRKVENKENKNNK